jgi:hypothetical protein
MASKDAPDGFNRFTDIPFDLNKIFSLTYEFQPLKEVLEHLFGRLHGLNDRVEEHGGKLER